MATAPRDKVQKWAPALPKELRAKTGKGIPYLQFFQWVQDLTYSDMG